MAVPLIDPSSIFTGFGTQAAGEEQRAALNASMGRLKKGYGDANALQQPIYNIGLGAYEQTAGKQTGGAYDINKQMQNWQQDPGYQFALDQGKNQIMGKAAGQGMAHSPETTKGLVDYAMGQAAQQYGNVWNRNFEQNNADFSRGMQVANPAFNSANTMGQNDIGLGKGLAGIEEQKGGINATLAANPYSTSTSMIQQGGAPMIDPKMIMAALGMA